MICVDSSLTLRSYGLEAKAEGQLWERDLFSEACVRQEPHAKSRYMTKEDRQIEVEEFLEKLKRQIGKWQLYYDEGSSTLLMFATFRDSALWPRRSLVLCWSLSALL